MAYNLVSFFGLFGMIGLAWLLSENRKNFNFRVVCWGVGLQFLIALVLFKVPAGTTFFLWLNDIVVQVLNSATAGSKFVFGRLALSPGETGAQGETSLGFILAFQAFPTVIFFSSLMAILYYLRIMPIIIRAFAAVFCKLMRISGVEALVAASNIFVGIESALTVKPHLKAMTRSEACTILAVGLATVASNVLAFYVFTLKGQFPVIAGHLISASLLSAPAALAISKVIVPEAESPTTMGQEIHPHFERDENLFAAVMNGANAGLKMIVGIVTLLIAVVGLVALVDLILGGIGGQVNTLLGTDFTWSLAGILGFLFYPLTLMLGVPFDDAGIISKIIGERLILTEVVSYQHLNEALQAGLIIHPRSAVIATYALCGFAHLASMAIFVGGVSALAENKRNVLASVAWRALIAATLACLMTACVAGVFLSGESLLLGGS